MFLNVRYVVCQEIERFCLFYDCCLCNLYHSHLSCLSLTLTVEFLLKNQNWTKNTLKILVAFPELSLTEYFPNPEILSETRLNFMQI